MCLCLVVLRHSGCRRLDPQLLWFLSEISIWFIQLNCPNICVHCPAMIVVSVSLTTDWLSNMSCNCPQVIHRWAVLTVIDMRLWHVAVTCGCDMRPHNALTSFHLFLIHFYVLYLGYHCNSDNLASYLSDGTSPWQGYKASPPYKLPPPATSIRCHFIPD